MLRASIVLTLINLLFFTRNPGQTTDILSLNIKSMPSQNDTLSDQQKATLKSYPCPKECYCRMFVNPERIGVYCKVNKLDKNLYFSELNETSFPSYMVIECTPDDLQPGRLADGAFESLHAFVSVTIKNCHVAYVSERAFSGMKSLYQLIIQGGKIERFDEKTFMLPELSSLEAMSFTEAGLSAVPSLCHLENLWFVNFSGNSIKRFKDTGIACTNPGNIIIIDVSYNFLNNLPAKFETITPKLRCLVCAGNKIGKITATVFENLTDIEILNIKENHLTELPTDFLGNNSKMRTLKLAYNKINILPQGLFRNLRNMFFLNLNEMGLNNDVWPELKYLNTLQALYVNNNNLKSFNNETMCNLSKLKRLEVSGNMLQQIPNGTFLFQADLFLLNLSRNSIDRIEKNSFEGLSSLDVLDLQYNHIKTIQSDALSQLLALELLNVSYNHIETLPKFPLFLHVVDLRHNHIINIDSDSFNGIYFLNGISLESNRLTALPVNAFKTNINLQILNLRSNNISSVDNQIFPSQSKLQALILRNNSISSIESFTNKLFPHLKILDLSYNKLDKLAARKWESLFPNSIEELLFAGNQISFVQNFVFQLPNIRDIDLRMNRISSLTVEALKVAQTNLMPVNYYLKGNPLSCDCNLAWLKDVSYINHGVYYESYIIRDVSSLYCEKVYWHEPGLIKDLPISRFLCPYVMLCLDNCECCSNDECTCRNFCPQTCTCYKNNKQSVDIVACLGAKLLTVPQVISPTCTLLDLSGNNFRSLASGTFDTLSNLKELYLNHSHIYEIKEGAFIGLFNLSVLSLEYNFLHIIESAMFKDLHSLKYLKLSFNKITWIEEKSFDPLSKLQYLDLSANELKTISRHDFASMSKVSTLKLSGNPWSCDCQYLEMMNNFTLANAKHIADLHNVVCKMLKNSSSNATEIHPLSDLHLPDFCVNDTQTKTISSTLGTSAIAALSTILVLFIVSVMILGIGFWNREFLKVWCFVKFGWKFQPAEKEDEVNRPYDAFVSYSGHDEKFIIRELVPFLEKPDQTREGFKLCLHHRDFPVGAPIAETIISAVKQSKRVIIVLSDNFLNSEWCQYEFQTAHHQLLQEKKNRIIMILLHDINNALLDEELKLYLKTCTYVQYGDRWLWPKLEYAMPKSKRIIAQNLGDNYIDDEMEFMEVRQYVQAAEPDGDEIELIA